MGAKVIKTSVDDYCVLEYLWRFCTRLMNTFSGSLTSKLPKTGTSIFAVMSGLANEVGAINLSQGFPNFPVSEKLIELVHSYMKKGMNQYAPMQGVLNLREAISRKVQDTYAIAYDPVTEINITAGATQAIYGVITALVRPGDEVIVIEPAYDSYAPAVELNGGVVRYSSLVVPGYSVNWAEVRSLMGSRTRLIIINSPHNPTGAILGAADLVELDKITRGTDIVVLSDEVYEHLIFDGHRHESVCWYPALASRSFVIGSFGKTFHTTGWKTGFVLAPANLMAEFRKAHQFIVFAGNTPMQYAMADYLVDKENYLHLPEFYQRKRDYFAGLVSGSRFKIIPSYGTYFQLLDYSRISEESELDFAIRITKEFGVASVPVSPFYHEKVDNRVLRFCFAKTEETLEQAAAILCKI
jgi:methionine transaminase